MKRARSEDLPNGVVPPVVVSKDQAIAGPIGSRIESLLSKPKQILGEPATLKPRDAEPVGRASRVGSRIHHFRTLKVDLNPTGHNVRRVIALFGRHASEFTGQPAVTTHRIGPSAQPDRFRRAPERTAPRLAGSRNVEGAAKSGLVDAHPLWGTETS